MWEDDNLSKEKANELPKNNNFAKKELKENTPLEIKIRPKLN